MMMLMKCMGAEQVSHRASIEASWDRWSALLVLREDVVDVHRLDLLLVHRPNRGHEVLHRLHLVRKVVGQILEL